MTSLAELQRERDEWYAAWRSRPFDDWPLTKVAELDAKIRALTAPKPPSRFGYTIENGIDTLWLKNAHGARMIHGVASTPTINSHNYSLSSAGCSAKLPIPVLSSHEGHSCPIGEVVLFRRSSTQIYVRCIIHDEGPAANYAWRMIESGELRAFSGAAASDGFKLDGIVDHTKFYKTWRLSEVSICRKGANPDCDFEIYDEMRQGALLAASAGSGSSSLGDPVPPNHTRDMVGRLRTA